MYYECDRRALYIVFTSTSNTCLSTRNNNDQDNEVNFFSFSICNIGPCLRLISIEVGRSKILSVKM